MTKQPCPLLGALALAVAAAVWGQPLANWPVPATWTPPKATMSASAAGDLGNPMPFVAVAPCRIVDTRVASSDGFHQPAFSENETRTYAFFSSTDCPGIPALVGAYSVNVSYRPTSQSSYLTAFPTGTTMPVVATIVGYPTSWVGNAAVVPAGAIGQINVFSQHAAQVVIDVNGYYTQFPNNSEYLYLGGSVGVLGMINGYNASSAYGFGGKFLDVGTEGGSAGVYGENSQTPSSGVLSGVFGVTTNSSGNTAGVWGVGGPPFPQHACCGNTGVRGEASFNGVAGVAADRATVGVLVDASGNWLAEGQLGKRGNFAPQAYGVVGVSSSGNLGAGVKGVMGWDVELPSQTSGLGGFGVVGAGAGDTIGVMALTTAVGGPALEAVRMANYTGGVVQSWGSLAIDATTGVWAGGNVDATGNKNFVEPHPTEAGKVIVYTALEGPESGTYFRGRGRFEGRSAVVEVPESFRMVTDPDGLSIQVTPIGELASVAVVEIGLDRIVLKSSRDVEFFYTVNGVRGAYKEHPTVMVDRWRFVPRSADEKLPRYLPDSLRQRLVDNGTYNADGSVNMETAARLGWTRDWQERAERLRQQAVAVQAEHAARPGS